MSTTRLPTTNLKNDDGLRSAQIKGIDFPKYDNQLTDMNKCRQMQTGGTTSKTDVHHQASNCKSEEII